MRIGPPSGKALAVGVCDGALVLDRSGDDDVHDRHGGVIQAGPETLRCDPLGGRAADILSLHLDAVDEVLEVLLGQRGGHPLESAHDLRCRERLAHGGCRIVEDVDRDVVLEHHELRAPQRRVRAEEVAELDAAGVQGALDDRAVGAERDELLEPHGVRLLEVVLAEGQELAGGIAAEPNRVGAAPHGQAGEGGDPRRVRELPRHGEGRLVGRLGGREHPDPAVRAMLVARGNRRCQIRGDRTRATEIQLGRVEVVGEPRGVDGQDVDLALGHRLHEGVDRARDGHLDLEAGVLERARVQLRHDPVAGDRLAADADGAVDLGSETVRRRRRRCRGRACGGTLLGTGPWRRAGRGACGQHQRCHRRGRTETY